MKAIDHRPRYVQRPFPPYSYVPGHAPHPESDPRGHMQGQPRAPAPPLDPSQWQESEPYLYGVDLFNHGYYWEAHEAWESLWHAAGRHGLIASWLKALIKLAAAAVKLREGNGAGVARHARRSIELLSEVRSQLAPAQATYAGVALVRVDAIASHIMERSRESAGPEPLALLGAWIELAPDR